MPWLETVRLTADWLAGTLKDAANADQGVNAKIAGVPRDAGDLQPAAITVIDETRDNAAALRQAKGKAILAVNLAQPIDQQPFVQTIYRDMDVPLRLALALEDVETKNAIREASYLARAIVRSLRQMSRNENDQRRVRNGVHLLQLVSLDLVPASEKLGDRDVTFAIRPTWKVRDDQP